MIKGSFFLDPSVRLFPETGKDARGGGILLQPDPMRTLRMNPSAFSILEKCRYGYCPHIFLHEGNDPIANQTIAFLDALCQAQILEWKPSAENFEPYISIVIAVYNRSQDLYGCLESIKTLDYSQAKIEVIVVDDASTDESAAVARKFGAKVIVQSENHGQSAARNRGAKEASGEILAFIDSDCVAHSGWLKDLVPYFQDRRYVLVGGYVDSWYHQTMLDRYEAAKSALNMGKQKIIGAGTHNVFYVPTCNVLILTDVYLQQGGLDESMRVGEDVDFCWRLMKAGHSLIYVPQGKVMHKHRNQFLSCFKRRFDYGTSEPILYEKYPETTKRFPWQSGGMIFFLLCLLGLVAKPLLCFSMAAILLFSETWFKMFQINKRFRVSLPFRTILAGVFRSHFLWMYYLTCHFSRYYFFVMIILSIMFWKLAPVALIIGLFPPLVEFFQKKPRLNLPLFIFYFWMEQLFYQAGVFWGCMRKRNFRLYRISFAHAGFLKSKIPFGKRLKRTFLRQK